MTHAKNLLTLTVIFTLLSGTAHANQKQSPAKTKAVVSIVQQGNFVSIPLDTDFAIKKTPRIDRELSDEFDTDYVSKIEYDLLGNVDATFGLIKAKNVKSRYRVRSAMQPRGRYHKRLNSSLGAGISSKF